MAWAVITHSEKQFTNSSKNSIGKILSVKMIILRIISIYALAHYSYFLVTLGTVKHFPNVHTSVRFFTICVSSWYNGISEETVLACVPLHFLSFSVLNICLINLFQIEILLWFCCGGFFPNICVLRKGAWIRTMETKISECFFLNLQEN